MELPTVDVQGNPRFGGVQLVKIEADLPSNQGEERELIEQLSGKRLWVSYGGTLVLWGVLTPNVLAAVVARLAGMGCFWRIAHVRTADADPTVLWVKSGKGCGELLSKVVAEEKTRAGEARERRWKPRNVG